VSDVRAVYSGLPGFEDRPVHVHLVPGPLPWSSIGISIEPEGRTPWIEVALRPQLIPSVLAHELAHVYFHRLAAALPQLLEEGLCDLLADRVFHDRAAFQARLGTAAVSYLDSFTLTVRGAGAKAYLRYLVQQVPPVREALELSSEEFLRSDLRAKDAYYGLGWAIATCIGLEGIVRLAERAREAGKERTPVDWVLAAAGLAPLSQTSLSAAFARALGAPPGGGPASIVLTLEGAP